MCGIAGIIDFEGKSDGKQCTGKMLRSISYRGPDECGIYHSGPATIGNVRLSIIDIAGGQQPLTDPASRYWITFNGEIFNYKELRADLERKGNKFRTNSDTEVLLQLYAMYGHECLKLLNGQFAFAVWDKLEEELFIARDRMGIRPFFFNIKDNVFTFASEIKAIFRNNTIPRELNAKGLIQTFTFWTSLTPETAFKGVYELSPGCYGYFSRKGMRTARFWEMDFSHVSRLSFGEALEQFNELFSDSVRIRLRADVEVAAYLSGGIDSSATVAYIKDIEPGILNTFSISFSDKDYDESLYQIEAVNYFKTRHQVYTCTPQEIAEVFPRVVWHSEIPLTRTAPAPMYLLSKMVRQNRIKVVVTGEGSDEFLAGYDIFKEAMIRRFWASQPDSKFRPLLLKRLYQYIPQISNADLSVLRIFFSYRLGETGNPFYSHLLRWNSSNQIRKHLSEAVISETSGYSALDMLKSGLPREFDSWDPLARAQWLEASIFMSGYLLSSQGDRMGMANSVEGRYPFLDYRIIEFCNSLPSSFKLKGATEKYLLKKLLNGRIPEKIIKRTKQPYRAPVSNAFIGKNAPDYAREMLSSEQTAKVNVFDYNKLKPVLARINKTGSASEMDDMLLASVISTHLLFDQFIEGRDSIYEPEEQKNVRITEDTVPVLT